MGNYTIMRIISTKIHGVMDYLLGILLIGSPWLLGFANNGPEMWVPVIVGIAILLQSIMTDYELGIVKKIPMSAHLGMDVIAGIILAASPWLFGFSDYITTPHVFFGILEIGAGLMTKVSPSHSRNIAGI